MKLSERKVRSIIREEIKKMVSESMRDSELAKGVDPENAQAVAALVNLTLQNAGYRTQLGRRNSEQRATLQVDGIDGLPTVDIFFQSASSSASWYYGEIYDLNDRMLGELELKTIDLKQGDMRGILHNAELSFDYAAG